MNAKQALALVWLRQLAASGEAKAIREQAGLSIREQAAAIDASPSALFRWENGERIPRGDAAVRYAKFLEQLTACRSS